MVIPKPAWLAVMLLIRLFICKASFWCGVDGAQNIQFIRLENGKIPLIKIESLDN
jgi:hypothetical protein